MTLEARNPVQFDDLYRDLILDHYRRPRHKETLADATVAAEGLNPSCGDEIRVELRVEDGTVAGIAFGGMAEIYRAKTFDAHGHVHLVAPRVGEVDLETGSSLPLLDQIHHSLGYQGDRLRPDSNQPRRGALEHQTPRTRLRRRLEASLLSPSLVPPVP